FRTSGVARMRLHSTTGFLGIGLANPLFRLDVQDNINVGQVLWNDGYKVDGQRFLFMPGGVANGNTFVGVAGTVNFGLENTMVGYNSGGNMGFGCANAAKYSVCVGSYSGYELGGGYITCVGYKAGYKIGDGDFSTFVGAQAGENTACTFNNAFFGGFSGNQVTSGSFNTYLGTRSAFSATTGNLNIAVGFNSAAGLSTGSDNIVIGINSGNNLFTNSNNILIGGSADIGTGAISNAISIGDNTIVRNSNDFILGNNLMEIGIGLNNDPMGPQNKLEIDAGLNGMLPQTTGLTGASGLRLRDLHSNTATVSNPGNGVLSVNASGDVIYVPGGILGNVCTTPGVNPLGSSWQIPLAGNNFYFDDVAGGLGSVHIGTQTPCGPIQSRFDILNDSKPFAAFFQNNVNSAVATLGLRITNNNIGNGPTGGMQALVTTTGTGVAEGIQSQATSAGANAIGVVGISNGGATAGNLAIGVRARSIATVAADATLGVHSLAANGITRSVSGMFDVLNSSSPANFGLQSLMSGGTNAASVNIGYDATITNAGTTNSGINFNVTGATNANNGAIFNVTGASNNNLGGRFFVSGSTINNTGIDVNAFSPTTTNVGAHIHATDATLQNLATVSEALNTNAPTIADNWGVYGEANNPNVVNGSNLGVWGQAINSGNANNNVGVVGIANNSGAAGFNIGIYGEGTIAGYFTTSITTGGAISFSDRKLKKDIKTIESGLDLIKKLNPVTYSMKKDEFPELHFNDKKQYGFIAQEVSEVIPELVSDASKPEIKNRHGEVVSKGYELVGLNYDGIIPVLTKGIQEQQTIIEEQDEKLNELQKQIDELKKLITSTPAGTITNGQTTYEVELNDKASVVLDQNVPNPFAEQTVINFVIPEGAGRAQMLFHNAAGQLMKAVEITEKGRGQLTVFANDLSNGTYTYTLVVDNKVMGTKKMERQK
ncbi:MAG TPA: tail fiber domain-containing protein, partial [Flavobacteriales bacterium]|nr:tail fiber domain-containing protein [Flavobacteriales bacterium]